MREKNKYYSNNCFNCKCPIDGRYDRRCESCNWFMCPHCSSCGCDYGL